MTILAVVRLEKRVAVGPAAAFRAPTYRARVGCKRPGSTGGGVIERYRQSLAASTASNPALEDTQLHYLIRRDARFTLGRDIARKHCFRGTPCI